MIQTEIITLAAAIIALLGSLLSLFIASRLAILKERRQLVWTKEAERILQLEELAGTLVEDLGSHRPLEQIPDVQDRLAALALAAGQFARYPTIRQATRDLHNRLGILLQERREHRDHRSARSESETAFEELITACDLVLGRQNAASL